MKMYKFNQLIAASMLVMSSASFATPIQLSDFSGSETLIDFSSGYSISGNMVTVNGATFTSDTGNLGVNNWGSYFDNISGASLGNALSDLTSDTIIRFDAGTSINRFGLLLSTSPITTWTLSAFASDDSLIESVSASMPNSSDAVFLGLESILDISYFTITESGTGNGHISLIDDVRFESIANVSEPASIALLGLGLAGIGFSRKNKNA